MMIKSIFFKLFLAVTLVFASMLMAQPPQPCPPDDPNCNGGGTNTPGAASPIDDYIPVFVLLGLGIAGYYARKKQSKVA